MRKVAVRWMRSLADMLDTRPHVPGRVDPPLGLLDNEIQALKRLRSTEEWDVYLTALDRRAVLVGEGIIRAREDANLHELRGQILGIRISGGLIDEIVNAQTAREELDERRRSAAADATNRVIAATVNSPAFTRG